MRLFIAIPFTQHIIDEISTIQHNLKQFSNGNFTHASNLHLTLVFLGETSPHQLPLVQNTMDSIPFSPFTLQFTHLGSFDTGGEFLYWLGAEPSPALAQLQTQLFTSLTQLGFPLKSRRFMPHITLARQVTFLGQSRPGKLLSSPFHASVTKLCLMQSTRQQGKLVYSCLHTSHANKQ